MFLQSEPNAAYDIAMLAENMIRLGRRSEAIELVYEAMSKMGYPYRNMAEVAVSKLMARRSAETAGGMAQSWGLAGPSATTTDIPIACPAH